MQKTIFFTNKPVGERKCAHSHTDTLWWLFTNGRAPFTNRQFGRTGTNRDMFFLPIHLKSRYLLGGAATISFFLESECKREKILFESECNKTKNWWWLTSHSPIKKIQGGPGGYPPDKMWIHFSFRSLSRLSGRFNLVPLMLQRSQKNVAIFH